MGSTDPELREAVEALLAADRGADERLARPDVGITHAVRERAARLQYDTLGLVGRTVAHIRILEPIGSGGVVYRAEDMRLRRHVALKLPLGTLTITGACSPPIHAATALLLAGSGGGRRGCHEQQGRGISVCPWS